MEKQEGRTAQQFSNQLSFQVAGDPDRLMDKTTVSTTQAKAEEEKDVEQKAGKTTTRYGLRATSYYGAKIAGTNAVMSIAWYLTMEDLFSRKSMPQRSTWSTQATVDSHDLYSYG